MVGETPLRRGHGSQPWEGGGVDLAKQVQRPCSWNELDVLREAFSVSSSECLVLYLASSLLSSSLCSIAKHAASLHVYMFLPSSHAL